MRFCHHHHHQPIRKRNGHRTIPTWNLLIVVVVVEVHIQSLITRMMIWMMRRSVVVEQWPIITTTTTTTVNAFTTIIPDHHHHRAVLYHHHYRYRPSRLVLSKQPQPQHRHYRTSYLTMMPEGPEIRTVVDQLQDCIGQRLLQIHFVSGRYYTYNNDNISINNNNIYYNNNNQVGDVTTKTRNSVSSSSSRNKSGTHPDGFLTFHSTLTPYQVPNQSDDTTTTTNNNNNNNNNNPVDIITDCNCKGKFMYFVLDNGNANRRPTNIATTSSKHMKNDINNNNNNNNNDMEHNYQRSIWMTFGMTGRFLSERIVQQYQLEERECHIRWYMEFLSSPTPTTSATGRITRIYYSDVRGFGTLKFSTSRLQLYEKLHSLGPDLLRTCTEPEFVSILQQQKPNLNICRFLMDQTKVCGIGNYILAEGLYRAKIDPFASLSEIIHHPTIPNGPQVLYQAMHAVIHESYESQTTDPDDDHQRHKTYEFQCYGQTTCQRYGHPVRKEVNGPHGRTIWYTDAQLFMSRSERQPNYSPNLATTTTTTSFTPIPNTSRTKTTNDDVLHPKMSEKRSFMDMGITEEVLGVVATHSKNNNIIDKNMKNTPTSRTTSIMRVSSSSSTKPLTNVATARTPGNLKLAAILSNRDGHNKTTKTTSGIELDDTTTIATTPNIDTTKLVTKLLYGITEPGWKEALYDTFQTSETFTKLALFLYEEEMAGKTIYPPHHEIFTALNLCPIDTVKVVILGQDPYHRYGQGHGLAFSVRKSVRPPPSLQNIFKELMDDIGLDGENIVHGHLSSWAKRGVLLLNTVLTVREGEAFSHANHGWEEVTNTILRVVCERNALQTSSSTVYDDRQSPRGVVCLLWGNAAIQTMEHVLSSQPPTDNNQYLHVIKTSHPSPLGATKTKSPFLGSKCFSRTNQALIKMGHDPIDWSVD